MKQSKKEQLENQFAVEAGAMSNSELLEETIDSACGDDYEGAFTEVGLLRDVALNAELRKRLIECGFLPNGNA